MFYNSATSMLAVIWISILALVFIVLFFNALNRRTKYRMIERLAEKGQTFTPEMLAAISNGNDHRDRNPITSGIYLMCIGVALTIFFWATVDFQNPLNGGAMPTAIGIIPFMIGLARVLGAKYGRRDDDKQP